MWGDKWSNSTLKIEESCRTEKSMVLTHKQNEAALVSNRLLCYSPSHWNFCQSCQWVLSWISAPCYAKVKQTPLSISEHILSGSLWKCPKVLCQPVWLSCKSICIPVLQICSEDFTASQEPALCQRGHSSVCGECLFSSSASFQNLRSKFLFFE